MESIEVDGIDIAYARAGDGPPVLFLHGYVGDARSTWLPQLAGLADEFTVVAWDAPGAGASSDPPETLGIAGYADALAGLVDALGLDRPHVVGLSFGGALGIEFARRHPDRIRSLTLVAAYAGWAGSLPPEQVDHRLQQAMTLSDASADEFVDALLPTMFAPGTDPAAVDAFEAALRARHPVGFRAMARASAEDLREALPEVAVPTLLVYGDQDTRAPIEVAEAIAAGIADSKLVVLPGVGHICSVEAPEAFNHTLREFLVGVRTAT